MKKSSDLGAGARLLFGLAFIAAGVMPMLAAFDIGPLRQADINGPPWLGFAAGGVFVAAGAVVALDKDLPWLRDVLVLSILVGMAAIINWIAFGVGERVCSGGFSFGFFGADSDLAGLGCRIPFGFGALITNAMVLFFMVEMLQKRLGGPPLLTKTKKMAEWLIILSLSPLLIVMVLVLAMRAGGGILLTRLKTGAWPHNENFIARQREKGLLRRFGKPPAEKE
ncbi:MAG: hypothetical protein H6943_10000 [Zoogloeaceae bacterium]|nr:hypothetical protein [Zoogloeaceae bacterium]